MEELEAFLDCDAELKTVYAKRKERVEALMKVINLKLGPPEEYGQSRTIDFGEYIIYVVANDTEWFYHGMSIRYRG